MKKEVLIKKGAEASLYLQNWHNRKVIMKKRLSKKYRIPELDKTIQAQRTKRESQIMHKAKEAGVSTPIVYFVDLQNSTIVMEYIEGKQVKQILNEMSPNERTKIFTCIGELVGKLHAAGIVHGDLTTSNMILTQKGDIVFIDFGLSEQTWEVEARGVDLHLMKRAIMSTHFMYADECFKAVLDGYQKVMGKKAVAEILDKIAEIERRGRYITER
ncbi:MAG: KEOPS complex kinase/ATPase Bud32 [Candidatus Bathyarchaeia archaeon]|nr:Kae1-associated serine/threonine protein kinase [Candidatus Bathyarchaeota archaeon]